jgi:hypothetical protein
MRKFVAGVIITLAAVFIIRSCTDGKEDKSILE